MGLANPPSDEAKDLPPPNFWSSKVARYGADMVENGTTLVFSVHVNYCHFPVSILSADAHSCETQTSSQYEGQRLVYIQKKAVGRNRLI